MSEHSELYVSMTFKTWLALLLYGRTADVRMSSALCLLGSKSVKALSVLLMSIIKPPFLNPGERNTLILEATEMPRI